MNDDECQNVYAFYKLHKNTSLTLNILVVDNYGVQEEAGIVFYIII